jgi:hypothetical protein
VEARDRHTTEPTQPAPVAPPPTMVASLCRGMVRLGRRRGNGRTPPAPDEELVAGKPTEEQHRQIGEQETGGATQLRPGADEEWRHYGRPLAGRGDFWSSLLKRAVLAVSALFFQQCLLPDHLKAQVRCRANCGAQTHQRPSVADGGAFYTASSVAPEIPERLGESAVQRTVCRMSL